MFSCIDLKLVALCLKLLALITFHNCLQGVLTLCALAHSSDKMF